MWSVVVLDLELKQAYFAVENVNQWDALDVVQGLTEKDCLIAVIPWGSSLDAWCELLRLPCHSCQQSRETHLPHRAIQ